LPVDSEIRDFSLKIILLNKNYGLIVSLKHQKTCPMGRVFGKKKNFFQRKIA